MLLLKPDPSTRTPVGPEQGVIEDARRRQRLRRKRHATATLLAAGLIAGVAWVSSGAATRTRAGRAGKGSATTVLAHSSRKLAFNVRLVPMLNFIGVAGWCEVVEEHGITGGSACGGVPTPSQPLLQVQGSGEAHSPVETKAIVSDPHITAILIDGHRRVPTTPLPGLPYGLRGARIVTRVGATLAALDEHGQAVPQVWSQPPRQATIRRWRYPHRPPRGRCQLQVSGLPGLTVRGGTIATSIRPFPGRLVGRAFLPCADGEFELRHEPLRAIVVLDAAQPALSAASLPSFHAVRGAPGMFAGGSLTAMRSGSAWLVVEQGRGSAERMLLLRHLTAVVHVGR
jgi:hypothetical protein